MLYFVFFWVQNENLFEIILGKKEVPFIEKRRAKKANGQKLKG
jgi:hypothetical protein